MLVFPTRDQFHSLSKKLQRKMTNIPVIKISACSFFFLLFLPLFFYVVSPVSQKYCPLTSVTFILLVVACNNLSIVFEAYFLMLKV